MILLAFFSILPLIGASQTNKCAANEACLYFTLCGDPGSVEKIEFYNSSTLFTPHHCAVAATHQTLDIRFRPINAHDLSIHLESTMSSLKGIEFALNNVSFHFLEWNNLIVKEEGAIISKNFTETSKEGYPFAGNFTIAMKESSHQAFAHLLITIGGKTWPLPGFAERLRDSAPSSPSSSEDDHLGWAIFGSLILVLLIGGGVAACCYMIYRLESLDNL